MLLTMGCIDKGKVNYQNSTKVNEGISGKEVVEIMGRPTGINNDPTYLNELSESLGQAYDSIFFYTPPFTASDGIYIYFKKDTVVKIRRE